MSFDLAPTDRLQIPPSTRALISDLQTRSRLAVMASMPTGEPGSYLYDLLPSYPERASKALRPVLCLASCLAHGGTVAEAMPFAVSLELMHNAFLVHDDIQDESDERRGRPSLHVEHGVPLALNAGDALVMLANIKLACAAQSLGGETAALLLERWGWTMRETIEGQALDLGWQRDNVTDLVLDDYFVMAGKKTAWYTTILPLAVGALVGSRRTSGVDESFDFGWTLGLLFQIANDLRGLDPPNGSGDISEGKRTILIVHLLGVLDGCERAELTRIIGLPRVLRGRDEVAWVRDRMEEHGSVEFARACLFGLVGAAVRQAELAFSNMPDTPARQLLLSITPYLMEMDGLLPPPPELALAPRRPVEVRK